jgi:L-malate glycosyltransferase
MRLENRGKALEDRSIPPEVELVRWKGGRGQFRRQDALGLLKDFKKVVRQLKPDVVHAGPIQGPAFIAALGGGKPLVSMSWGYDLLMDAGRNTALEMGNPPYHEKKRSTVR